MKLSDIAVQDNSIFLSLDEGSNKVRIMSDFAFRETEFNGNKITKYCCWVIDRKTGDVKLGSFGKSIIKQLQQLQSSDEYGFDTLPRYDIDIQRKGTGLDTAYTIIPARTDTPLTDAETKAVEEKGSVADFVKKLGGEKTVTVDDLPFN